MITCRVAPPISILSAWNWGEFMKVAQPASSPYATPVASSCASRRQRSTSVALFVALLCSGATSCTRTQIALSATAIGVVVAGTAVGVTYAVKHHNHTLQGCVFSDAGELKLRTSDAKVYLLKGDATNIKTGDSVRLHGSKVKKAKGDSTSNQVFEVQKLNKDRGSCPTNSASPTSLR
jgi:hypothetical protein